MARKASKVLSYYAVFEPAVEGGFNVSFPDFPGCVTFGDNLTHAKKMAQEALELWIEVLESKKKKIPKQKFKSTIEQVKVKVSY